jgi:hypothetical protein
MHPKLFAPRLEAWWGVATLLMLLAPPPCLVR